MDQDGAEAEAQHPWRYGYSRATLCLVCCMIVALPAAYLLAVDSFEWPGVMLPLAACGGGMAYTVHNWRKSNARRRRIIRATWRISSLAASLPHRTDEETLAALGEIRGCYAEAHSQAKALNIGGFRLADQMRDRLDRIDRAYDAEAGRMRRADASVADVARDVREFSMEVGGLKIH